jgi:hypothetical protein
MHQLVKKKVNFYITQSQFAELGKIATSLRKTQSDIFREALEEHFEKIKRTELERSLAEGYRANAELDLKISDEFKYVDSENI